MSEDNPYDKPDRCTNCTLYLEPGPVHGKGNRNAKILYVGEAPGSEEVDAPRHCPERFAPFVGGAGRVRNSLLGSAGLHKDTIFTTNCVKCRPPGNRLPTDLEVACCAPFLIAEIEDVKPNVIVAAGDLALRVLTEKKGISLWRGVPTTGPTLNGRSYKVFPTWHPSHVMRVQWNWAFAVHDLVRAKAEAEFPEIHRVPISIERQARHDTHAESLRTRVRERGAVTFDFETTGLHASSSAIQICGFVGGPDQADVFTWSPDTSKLLQEFLDDPTVEVCGQNILYFDLPYAEEKGLRVTYDRIFDTMVAFYLCNSSYGSTPIAEQNAGTFRVRGTEKDLSFIASNHTDLEYWKSRESYKSDLRMVCGLDVIATDRSAYGRDGIKAELKQYDMLDLYYKHVLPVHPVIHKMSKRGFRIDEGRAAAWSLLLQQNADRMEKELKEGLGDPLLNLNSPQQLMDLLYNKLQLPKQYTQDKKKGPRLTANAEALETLAQLAPENKILMHIVNVRHLRKMDSTYVQPGLTAPDNKLHPRFGVAKTANGRFNGWEPNAQNVPEEMRDIWIPDSPDHVILSADASQIEWRLAMVLSGDPVGLALLAAGVDNHRAVAAETFGRRIEDIDDATRHAAKFIVYGLGYGRGAASIADGHGLDLAFVDEFIGRFFNRFNVFRDWRNGLPARVKETNFLANPWKRRRWWYTRNITEIYNFPASSSAADMMIDELIMLEAQLPKDATLRLTVHDEVVLNVAKDVVREAWECVSDVMQQKWPKVVEASARPEVVRQYYPDGWFCPADIHLGTNWKMCKSKNADDKVKRLALERSFGL